MKYETLLDEAHHEGLIVKEKPLKYNDGRIKGKRIAIRNNIDTLAEKTCVLAEEIGHYETTVGDILDQRISENKKQELQARMYAYNKLIGLQGIIDCYEYGCKNVYEMAEHLEVTEKFVVDALDAYKRKYGLQTKYQDYIVRFDPSLVVMKII